jgi:cell wall-associated NlpC family hydrolase
LRGESYAKLRMEADYSWGKFLLGAKRLRGIILAAAVTLFLTLSPNPARAQAGSQVSPFGDDLRVRMGKSYTKSSGVSEILTTKVMAPREGQFLMASLRPLRPFDRLPRFTSPFTGVSPASTPRSIRSAPSNLMDRTLTQARDYLGAPYRRGGSLQTGRSTDCSGFARFIYRKVDIDLPRSSSEQARQGVIVARNLDFAIMQPGDLLFFGRGGRHIGHVGIYLGDGKMIHASGRRLGVTITDLHQSSYEGAFVVAKRLWKPRSPQSASIR